MNRFSYKISLYKLSRERDKADKELSKSIREAVKKHGEQIENEIYQTESYKLNEIDESIAYLKTRYLISKAEKMSLPIQPANDDFGFWERGHFTGKWCLTNKGITDIRASIRKERKESLELFLPWISMLIGVIGAITGLVAAFKK